MGHGKRTEPRDDGAGEEQRQGVGERETLPLDEHDLVHEHEHDRDDRGESDGECDGERDPPLFEVHGRRAERARAEEEKEEAEREAKDVILEALVNAREKEYNPFDDSKSFLLANLINQAKIDALIGIICEKKNLNEEDFEHHAYDDGALLDVKYKDEIIA